MRYLSTRELEGVINELRRIDPLKHSRYSFYVLPTMISAKSLMPPPRTLPQPAELTFRWDAQVFDWILCDIQPEKSF